MKSREDAEVRQIALKLLSLHYERNFIWEMLKGSNTDNVTGDVWTL